jgi:hypothetical protein
MTSAASSSGLDDDASRLMSARRLWIRLRDCGLRGLRGGFTAIQRQQTALLSAALRFAWISRIVAGASGRQVCPAWRPPPHRSRHRRSWA